MNTTETRNALEITRENMRDYGIYISQGRSYPCIYDGLKSAYKRAIYGMHENNKHQIVKVAELAAYALPYHPHPTSISPVIVSLGDNGNKLKFLDTQGNFGDSSKGVEASADRYIGGKLSDLTEHLMCDSVEYCKMIKGEIEKDEPEALPTLLPICFINGLTGIPSGLPTLNIPTLNIDEMIDCYISILSHKDVNYEPTKLPSPNLELNIISTRAEWEEMLKTGKGSIKVGPIMDIDKDNVIRIYATPGNKDVASIIKILEKEYLQEKIDIRDESGETTLIVIEKVPKKQCDMKELYNKLLKKLQMSINYNMAFFDYQKIYVPCSFQKVIRANLNYVIQTQQNKLTNELADTENKLKVLEIIEEMKTSNAIKKITEFDSKEAIEFIVKKYKCSEEIARNVMQKSLTYLTKEHEQEIIDLRQKIEDIQNNTNDIYEYLIKKYKIIKKEIDSIIKNKFIDTVFLSEKPVSKPKKVSKKKEGPKKKSTTKTKTVNKPKKKQKEEKKEKSIFE